MSMTFKHVIVFRMKKGQIHSKFSVKHFKEKYLKITPGRSIKKDLKVTLLPAQFQLDQPLNVLTGTDGDLQKT